jgi:Fe-S cluster biosynthesis and repair protein YggX
MKLITRGWLILLIGTFLSGCAAVEKSTRDQFSLHDPEQLRADVDFVYSKLRKLHPRLYEYTRKESLDHQFDSLKNAITTPLTSREFYFKLSPVVAAVRQGHIQLQPPQLKIGLLDAFNLGITGRSPLFQYNYELIDNKLYIINTLPGKNKIKPGSELVSVNNLRTDELISKFIPTQTFDGFNQTYVPRKVGKDFPNWHYLLFGRTDSLVCQLKYNDSLQTQTFVRNRPKITSANAKSRDQIKAELPARKIEREKRHIQGYDYQARTYSKDLTFPESDSSLAILTIRNFNSGVYASYYKTCFELLNSVKTKTLILDLRDNPGGEAADAQELFSYLVDTTFTFLGPAEVASKFSIVHSNYFRGNPLIVNIILAIGYPIQVLSKGILILLVQRDADHKYYLSFPESWNGNPKTNHFSGEVYVIANGGTFSAAAILASNLKGINRATLVGEETGGAALGTVAGKMAVYKLPASKIWFSFGLAHIQPHYRFGYEGRGVLPDIRIIPTVKDRINGVDPEIKWVRDHRSGFTPEKPNPVPEKP